MVFVFYQFEKPPLFFNQPAYAQAQASDSTGRLAEIETRYDAAIARQQEATLGLAEARRSAPPETVSAAKQTMLARQAELQALRTEAKNTLQQLDADLETKDSDYVFITWVLTYLPHGVIGLLVAVIFCAAMSSTAAELNALGSTSEVDFYRPLIRPEASEEHYLLVAKLLTTGWGIVAIGFALFANLVENLIEAVNILGSIFYGPILGLFLTAFFLRRVGGTAAFTATLIAQVIVIVIFKTAQLSYLWLNPIGCGIVLMLALLLQNTLFAARRDD
jgi:Na+(H+)/acetate symporter ActP